MMGPVMVMKQTTQREKGRKAQLGNIAAAKAVADIIRTTLGPRSMLKMILDPMGGIVLTNDGNAILREVDVSHPAAKSMIELSRTQDEEVGDGTTSVIILAGQLLQESRQFLEQKMHPRRVVYAYMKALDMALETVDSIAIKLDVNDRKQMLNLVRSTLGTKFVSRFGDMVCDLALDAVMRVTRELDDGKKEIDIKRYARVERIPGGYLQDSKVLQGVMINKDIVHPKMRRRIENPRIILLDSPLEFKKGESQTNIEITNETDWDVILKMEEEYIEKLCADIIKHKPDVVITEKGVSDLAQHYFIKAGISCLRRVRKTDNNRIARAVGATIVNEPSSIKERDVGVGCGLFEVRKIGDEYFTYMEDCKDPKACSIVLRGASKDVLQEIDRNLQDAMATVRNIVQEPRVLPGGGAVELAIGRALRVKSKQIGGVQQWPFRAVADALEVIPRTLIENCGANVIRTLTELRAKHAGDDKASSRFGVNGITGKVSDMVDLGVVDPYAVKIQTIKTAIEASCMLLRIDDIVSGVSAPQ